MAVELRHDHDILFTGTQSKTMAPMYYLKNYAMKVEDPVWKHVAAAAELKHELDGGGPEGRRTDPGGTGDTGGAAAAARCDSGGSRTRRILMKLANRVFTGRPLSQLRLWSSTRPNSRATALRAFSTYPCSTGTSSDESILVEEIGQKVSFVEAYCHRGQVFRGAHGGHEDADLQRC